MPKPVPGNPQIDEQLAQWLEHTKKIWIAPSKISKNLDQQTLRDIIFTIDIIRAHCAKNLDWRNEQSVGGIKGNLLQRLRELESK